MQPEDNVLHFLIELGIPVIIIVVKSLSLHAHLESGCFSHMG